MNNNSIRKLAVSSVMIALAAVLSLIKVYELPMGGSITLLSMLPIALIAVMYGVGTGIASAFIYSLIQLAFGIVFDGIFGWGLSWQALVGTILLDYLLAYSCLGLSGLFRKKGIVGIGVGVGLAIAIRFVSHLASGIIIFGQFTSMDSWVYSLSYNGSYMLPELIFTVIASVIIFKLPQVKRFFK